MSLSTFSGLITATFDRLDREEDAVLGAQLIGLTEARLNRDLRVGRMIKRATATITDGFSAVPTDFLAPRSMRLASSNKLLAYLDPEQMAIVQEAGGLSELTYYSLVGDEFEYAPAPSDATDVALTYYARIPALSDANTTNWLLTAHPDVYLHGAVLEGAIHLFEDELATASLRLFEAAKQAVQAASTSDAFAFNITPQVGVQAI